MDRDQPQSQGGASDDDERRGRAGDEGDLSTDDRARALLGLAVWADGVRLGAVDAVWIDPGSGVLGLEVEGAWNDTTHYLPFAAARIEGGVVRASPLAVLETEAIAFFADRGAVRVTTDGDDGFRPGGLGVGSGGSDPGTGTGDDGRHGVG